MRNCLEILKKQKTQVKIIYSNGKVEKGFIKDYDRMGFIYTPGMLEASPTNPMHLVPWEAILNITV